MKLKFITSAVIFFYTLLYGGVVCSEEIEMTCTFQHKDFYDGKLQKKRLKYLNPFFSRKTVLRFRDEKWQEWCRPLPVHYKPCDISISKNKTYMIGYLKDKLLKKTYDKPKGFKLIRVIKYNLNFTEPKLQINTHYETYTGKRLFNKSEDWERWSCELN